MHPSFKFPPAGYLESVSKRLDWDEYESIILQRMRKNAEFVTGHNSMISEYPSKWLVIDESTGQSHTPIVKVYSHPIFGLKSFDFDIFLYHGEKRLGQVSVGKGVYYPDNIDISNLWKFELEYSLVGTVLLKEAIVSTIFQGKGVQDSLLREEWLVFAQGAPVQLESAFPALLFYDRFCFKLKSPQELRPSDPRILDKQFLMDLENLETFFPEENGTEYEHPEDVERYKRMLAHFNLTVSSPGLYARFKQGHPTEEDWQRVMSYLDWMYGNEMYYNARLDYEDIRQEMPDVDPVDFHPLMLPQQEILEQERRRFAETGKKRRGFHHGFYMVLDREAFMEKFAYDL